MPASCAAGADTTPAASRAGARRIDPSRAKAPTTPRTRGTELCNAGVGGSVTAEYPNPRSGRASGRRRDGREVATPSEAGERAETRLPQGRHTRSSRADAGSSRSHRHSRARQGREPGRQDAAASEVPSERVTDPERAAGAPTPSTAPDLRRSGPGHPEGGANRRTRRPPAAARENPDGDKDPSAARATRRQPSRSSRLCRANKGVVSEANETRRASRLLMPFSNRATASDYERQRVEVAPVAYWGNRLDSPSLRPVADT